jgi:hypothetical protein
MGSMRRWLKARLRFGQTTNGAGAAFTTNLLESPPLQLEAPARVGVDLQAGLRAWSVARLAHLFEEAERNPSIDTLLAARQARHCLSCFWLTAPVDGLEALYRGPIGDLQRQQLGGLLPQQPLARDEQQWRDRLAAWMADPAQAAQRGNLLLALMPYAAAGSLKVEQAVNQLPEWLLADYVRHCEPELERELDQPAAFLPSGGHGGDAWPVLCDRRGEEALAWFRDPKALKRMQALINLYGIDPADPETLSELAGLRQVAAQLWLDVEANQLKTLYDSPVGLLSRSLITCGFGCEVVDNDDRKARKQLAHLVEDLGRPEAINALMAALLYFPLEKVTFEDATNVPAWLLEELRSFG